MVRRAELDRYVGILNHRYPQLKLVLEKDIIGYRLFGNDYKRPIGPRLTAGVMHKMLDGMIELLAFQEDLARNESNS